MNNTELIKQLISNSSEKYDYNTLTFLNLLPNILNKSTMFKDFLNQISVQTNATYPILKETDFGNNSVFNYIQEKIDQDIKTKNLKKGGKSLWNDGLNALYTQINQYTWDKDWVGDYDIDTEPFIPFGNHLKTLINIYESDAGNSFEITQDNVVIPFENIDDKNYLNIRDSDRVQSILENNKALNFTEEENSKFIRLLMPKNTRRVEIEDLNRNFWVIGQVISLISSELFSEQAPLLKPLELLLEEIIQQWQNIIYLWLLSSIVAQDQKITLHCEVVDLPISTALPFRKFDNFDYGINNTITADIVKERCKYLINKYSNSNLCILPRIKMGNYMKNYYNMEAYPYILLLNRYKGQKDFQVIQLTYETLNFGKIPAFCIEGGDETKYDSSNYSQSIAAIKEVDNYNIEKIAQYSSIKNIDVSTPEEPFFGFIRIVPSLSATFNENEGNFTYVNVSFKVYDMANENGTTIKEIQSITTASNLKVSGEIAGIKLERTELEKIDNTTEIETLLNYATPSYYGEMVSSPVYKNVDNINRDISAFTAPYNSEDTIITGDPVLNINTVINRLKELKEESNNKNKNLAVLFYQRADESNNQPKLNEAIYFPAIGFYDINKDTYVCRFLKTSSNNEPCLYLDASNSEVKQISYAKAYNGKYRIDYPSIENLEPDQNTLYSSYLQWNSIIEAKYVNNTIEVTNLSIEIRDQLNKDDSTNLLYKIEKFGYTSNDTNNITGLKFTKMLNSITKEEGETSIGLNFDIHTLVGEETVPGFYYDYTATNVQFEPVNGEISTDNNYIKEYMKIKLKEQVLNDYDNRKRIFYIFTSVRYNRRDSQDSFIKYETIQNGSIVELETNLYGGADHQITSIGIFDPIIYSSKKKMDVEEEEALLSALVSVCPKDEGGNYVKQGFNTRSYACFVQETYGNTDPLDGIVETVNNQSHTYLYFADHSQFFSTHQNWSGGEKWDIQQYSKVEGAKLYLIKGTYSSYDGYLSGILGNLAQNKIGNAGTVSGFNPNLRGDLYRFYFEYDPSETNEQDKIKVFSQTREQLINGTKANCKTNLQDSKIVQLPYTLDAYQIEKTMYDRPDSTHQEIGFTKLWRNLLWMYMTDISDNSNVIIDLSTITRQNDNCYVNYTVPFTYLKTDGTYDIDTINIRLRYGYWSNNEFSGYCCKYNNNTDSYELAEGSANPYEVSLVFNS